MKGAASGGGLPGAGSERRGAAAWEATHGDPGQGSAMPVHGSRHLSDDVALGRDQSVALGPRMAEPFSRLWASGLSRHARVGTEVRLGKSDGLASHERPHYPVREHQPQWR